jgi:acetyl-CoA carboxylase biotin carboxylase subunit
LNLEDFNTPGDAAPRPHGNCDWVLPGRLLAGEHPGLLGAQALPERLIALQAAGIQRFIDLTAPADPVPVYQPFPVGGQAAQRECHPITDFGVPTVPGSDGLIANEQEAVRIAKEIGFPVLLKATAGGGGKGMRVAANDLALASAWQQASAEAQAAFGNPGIYIEKYIERPRHVEIQILGDQHGNMFHLWERDCSTQRRHQKLIEESPSPRLPQAIRQKMADAAVRLAKTAGYYSAGTVEFIVDQQDNFYFIEVNARIQVEHPVSEMVTGIDLLKAQIRVAAGEKLDLKQADIKPRGHAIECRINAEDPDANFRPCPGRIDRIIAPGGFGVRWDSHATTGYVVPPYYDSLVGKLIVHQPTRKEAIETMIRALKELRVEGIKTTVPLHLKVLSNNAFHEAQVDTTFVERMLAG